MTGIKITFSSISAWLRSACTLSPSAAHNFSLWPGEGLPEHFLSLYWYTCALYVRGRHPKGQTIYVEQSWRHGRLKIRLTCPKTDQACFFDCSASAVQSMAFQWWRFFQVWNKNTFSLFIRRGNWSCFDVSFLSVVLQIRSQKRSKIRDTLISYDINNWTIFVWFLRELNKRNNTYQFKCTQVFCNLLKIFIRQTALWDITLQRLSTLDTDGLK